MQISIISSDFYPSRAWLSVSLSHDDIYEYARAFFASLANCVEQAWNWGKYLIRCECFCQRTQRVAETILQQPSESYSPSGQNTQQNPSPIGSSSSTNQDQTLFPVEDPSLSRSESEVQQEGHVDQEPQDPVIEELSANGTSPQQEDVHVDQQPQDPVIEEPNANGTSPQHEDVHVDQQPQDPVIEEPSANETSPQHEDETEQFNLLDFNLDGVDVEFTLPNQNEEEVQKLQQQLDRMLISEEKEESVPDMGSVKLVRKEFKKLTGSLRGTRKLLSKNSAMSEKKIFLSLQEQFLNPMKIMQYEGLLHILNLPLEDGTLTEQDVADWFNQIFLSQIDGNAYFTLEIEKRIQQKINEGKEITDDRLAGIKHEASYTTNRLESVIKHCVPIMKEKISAKIAELAHREIEYGNSVFSNYRSAEFHKACEVILDQEFPERKLSIYQKTILTASEPRKEKFLALRGLMDLVPSKDLHQFHIDRCIWQAVGKLSEDLINKKFLEAVYKKLSSNLLFKTSNGYSIIQDEFTKPTPINAPLDQTIWNNANRQKIKRAFDEVIAGTILKE